MCVCVCVCVCGWVCARARACACTRECMRACVLIVSESGDMYVDLYMYYMYEHLQALPVRVFAVWLILAVRLPLKLFIIII